MSVLGTKWGRQFGADSLMDGDIYIEVHLFMRRISAAVYGRPEASLVSTMTRRRGRFWPLLFSQSLSRRSSRLRSMSMSSLRACV